MPAGLAPPVVRARYPAFDAIRLVAAAGVVFSHSFLIATGSEETEPFQATTGEILGVYGVYAFFILSGFLVAESARRSRSAASFIRKRALRILPGFIVANLVTMYLVAPPFTADAWAFVTSRGTLREFLMVTFLVRDVLYLPSVLMYPPDESAKLIPLVVNGTLWTIRLEILGYALIGLLSLGARRIARLNKAVLLGAVSLAVLVIAVQSRLTQPFLASFAFVFPSLLVGIAMNVVARLAPIRGSVAAVSTALLLAALFWLRMPQLFPLFMAYPLIWLGERGGWLTEKINGEWDLSYGLYLYGWPVTQLLRAATGPGLSGYEMTALALPLSAIVAALSWKLVEKPMLRFK